MAKLSMAQAAKMFAVSRPTLADHLKKGKISGEKTPDGWRLDLAELQRVYQYRDVPSGMPRQAELAAPSGQPAEAAAELQAEIRVLRAQLQAAEALAEERAKHLDDLRKLLTVERPAATRKRWWPFGRGD